jgi:hypothetical protein
MLYELKEREKGEREKGREKERRKERKFLAWWSTPVISAFERLRQSLRPAWAT